MPPSPPPSCDLVVERAGPRGAPPVVLLHAGIADRRMWDPQWPALTATRDSVRMDLRGFGDSTARPAGARSHSRDVIDALDHLDVRGCHLVGASVGAGVATEVAMARPDLARSLVLCPPGGSLLDELTPDLAHFFEAEGASLARGDLEGAVQANIDAWVVGNGRDLRAVDPAVVAAVRVMQHRAFSVASAWGDVDDEEVEPPVLARLATLRTPVLVLVGRHDLDTTHLAARFVTERAPDAWHVDWSDVAHLPSMEAPQDFLELLTEWVGTHDRD